MLASSRVCNKNVELSDPSILSGTFRAAISSFDLMYSLPSVVSFLPDASVRFLS